MNANTLRLSSALQDSAHVSDSSLRLCVSVSLRFNLGPPRREAFVDYGHEGEEGEAAEGEAAEGETPAGDAQAESGSDSES